MGTLKPQSSGPLYSNTVIGTLAADGWAVTFGTARRGLGGLRPSPVLSLSYGVMHCCILNQPALHSPHMAHVCEAIEHIFVGE